MKSFRSSLFAASVWLGAAAATLAGTIPRPAPDFSFDGIGGRKSLHSLRGQPVVLIVSRTPQTKIFRKQIQALLPIYQEFAGRNVVFVAAFSEAAGDVKSDIPFVLASNGAAAASAYDLRGDLIVAVIGRDGNLDLITDKNLSPFRIREVIQNNFDVQNAQRKETPKGPPKP